MTTVYTIVYAAPGCSGQYEELRYRRGWQMRTVHLFAGDLSAHRTQWVDATEDDAAYILARADCPVPAAWRARVAQEARAAHAGWRARGVLRALSAR